jgi:hypothetical protein
MKATTGCEPRLASDPYTGLAGHGREMEWPARVCYQPSKLVMRVRFPSSAPLNSAHQSDAGSIRAIEQLYGSVESYAYRELGSVSVGLTVKNDELKELLT